MSKLSNLIKPSLLLVNIIVVNFFISTIALVFYLESPYHEDIIANTNSSIFLCLFYLILTRFNIVRIISLKFQLIGSKYYNALLLLVVIFYCFLFVLYIGLTEQSKEYVNFVFFIFIPIYVGLVFHITNILSRTLSSDVEIENLFLPVKQKTNNQSIAFKEELKK